MTHAPIHHSTITIICLGLGIIYHHYQQKCLYEMAEVKYAIATTNIHIYL
jgi:deoxyhypusine synthase